LLPIMIVAAHLTKNRFSKSPILMNFCYANVGYSTSFLLSYYAGEDVWASPQAPFIHWDLCVPQGIATQVSTFWMCMCALCLTLQLWFTLKEGQAGRGYKSDIPSLWPKETQEIILTTLPYIFMPLIGIMVALIMLARPELISISYLFCGVDFQPMRITTATLDFIIMTVNFLFLCDISRRLYNRHVRLAITQTQVQGWTVIHLYLRLTCFIVPSILSIPATVMAGTDDQLIRVRYFIQASFPFLFFLMFGTSASFYLPDDKCLDWSEFPRIKIRTVEHVSQAKCISV